MGPRAIPSFRMFRQDPGWPWWPELSVVSCVVPSPEPLLSSSFALCPTELC